MTKKDLVLKISDEARIKQVHVKKVVQKFLDHIIDSLVQGQTVELRNFGVFKVKTRKGRKGRNSKVLVTLNNEWASAMWAATFTKLPSGPVSVTLPLMSPSTSGTYHQKRGTMMLTPIALKKAWARAARFASVLAGILASSAVIVVPMFSPRTSPAAV